MQTSFCVSMYQCHNPKQVRQLHCWPLFSRASSQPRSLRVLAFLQRVRFLGHRLLAPSARNQRPQPGRSCGHHACHGQAPRGLLQAGVKTPNAFMRDIWPWGNGASVGVQGPFCDHIECFTFRNRFNDNGRKFNRVLGYGLLLGIEMTRLALGIISLTSSR